MRILLVSHNYPPVVSGVSVLVQKFAREMACRGHTVAVLAGIKRASPELDDDGGIRLLRVGGIPNPWWKETVIPLAGRARLAKLIREFRPDVVHTNEAATLSIQVLRSRGVVPILASCHFVPGVTARYISWGSGSFSLMQSAVWAYTKALFKRFDHIVYHTEAQRKFFVEHGVKVTSSIISGGVDTSRYSPVPMPGEDVEVRCALPRRPRILFVGRLMKDKEIGTMIKAMPQVCAEREAHLLLVGRGDDQPKLEALVSQLGLEACVHFLGFVPEDLLPALFRASDLFAITSPYEVLSLPTLQAMATGLPVVAADAVALPELVHDGVNGFLVPVRDSDATAAAILRIIGDPGLARRMGEASLSLVRAHAESNTFDQYEGLYAQLANQKAKGSV